MVAIESFNVSKIYKNSNKKALNDISLQIEKGKISTPYIRIYLKKGKISATQPSPAWPTYIC